MAPRLTVEQRREARRLKARGWSLRAIAAEVGCSHESVRILERRSDADAPLEAWTPGPGRLTMADREEDQSRC